MGEIGPDEPGAAADHDGPRRATGQTGRLSEPGRFTYRVDAAAGPDAIEQLRRAVGVLQPKVRLPLIAAAARVVGLGGGGVSRGIPIGPLDRRLECVDERVKLTAFVVAPRGVAGLGDPDLGLAALSFQ